jgi:L-fuculose-phosphate aldolase
VVVVQDERSLGAPVLTPHAMVAILARALYREGWDDHNVGHITYRQEGETFLTLPVERGWDEMRASDIVRMDSDGNLLEGHGTITPPILLHLEFHRAQPGINVTAHQHPRYTTIWSTAGRVPPPYDQRSAWVASEEIAFYDDYEGGVDDIKAVRAAVAAIGDRPCAILRSHGAFTIGTTIAQAFTRSVSLEWRCRQAWHAEAIGGRTVVPEAGQRAIAEYMASEKSASLMAQLWEWAVRREIRLDPDVLA